MLEIEVIAIFDIGKTNKKFLLFDKKLKIVHVVEQQFEEIIDDDGFACDDIERIENWMKKCVSDVILQNKYRIKALNFATYGASLVYLDDSGRRLTPVYNYLKPMPEEVLGGFYETYGGIEEFSRSTASPALGMLNSGLQILWLRKTKPQAFKRVGTILHFPQYLSYCFTGKAVSEYTSIGCHTAMWDFDNNCYHHWIKSEGINLPEPVPNSVSYDIDIKGQSVKTGIGIHDSSSSLVPYFKGSNEQFILISTGTWCIFMNPFNTEPLTADQLKKDSLCYLSIQQQQVKSSRLFLGHIHDVNVEVISGHFGFEAGYYKKVKADGGQLSSLIDNKNKRIFFVHSMPADYIDRFVDLSIFKSFEEAYHQFMHDLVSLGMDSLNLIIPKDDKTKIIYISGGFARNEIFVKLIAAWLPEKKVYTSEIDNTTALGAAMVLWNDSFGEEAPLVDLGLKECKWS
jgi:sugar (pentulose or hexulose) kinase